VERRRGVDMAMAADRGWVMIVLLDGWIRLDALYASRDFLLNGLTAVT
jgi:hypothetical protein